MNKISSQIENHQFTKELVTDGIPTIERDYQKIKNSGQSFSQLTPGLLPRRSEFEQYSTSVFLSVMSIHSCFETLEHVRAYLGYFRTNKRYEEAGIGRSHHINYHYFNYAITVVRIIDVALILTNTTFRLGNPAKLCRLEYIIENSWVCSTGIDKLLKKLNSIVEPWRKPRNLFVHRGQTLDISGQRQDSKLLYLLGAYDILSREDESIASIPPTAPKSWYQSVVSGLYKEFEQTETPLFNATSELLTKLLPIYRFWRKMLTQTSSR